MVNVPTSRKKKTFVVLNPVAGRSDRGALQRQIRSILTEAQIPYHIHETTKNEDLHTHVKSALQRDYKQFVAIGGDGTVSGVARTRIKRSKFRPIDSYLFKRMEN